MNKQIKNLFYFSCFEMIATIFLFFYQLTRGLGLGVFVVSIIYLLTLIYYIVLSLFLNKEIKKRIRTKNYIVFIYFFLCILPIFIHLYFIDYI
jgi:hypothetical protein